jgi:putative transposase
LLLGLDNHADRFRFLIRDRDAKFAPSLDAVFTAVGVEILRTPIRAPRANAIAERWVGTARRELLDRLLILGRRHLNRALTEFVTHYNTRRPVGAENPVTGAELAGCAVGRRFSTTALGRRSEVAA